LAVSSRAGWPWAGVTATRPLRTVTWALTLLAHFELGAEHAHLPAVGVDQERRAGVVTWKNAAPRSRRTRRSPWSKSTPIAVPASSVSCEPSARVTWRTCSALV
jgi:hypothetical protein